MMTDDTSRTKTHLDQGQREHIFYDGTCGVCHWSVKFVDARDPEGRTFRFAPLGGDTFTALLSEDQRADLPDSLVVHTDRGDVLWRTSGLIHILRRLGGVWGILGVLLAVVPRPIRDFGYDRFAAIRHRVVKRPEGVCPLVPPALGARFDP